MAGGAGGGLHANDHSRHSHGRSNVGQALLSMVRVPTPPLTPRSPHGKDDQVGKREREEEGMGPLCGLTCHGVINAWSRH